MTWGRRKDNNKPYVKGVKKGVKATSTNAVSDVHLKTESYKKDDKFEHSTYLGIRSMLARYGSMTISDYEGIFGDLEGLEDGDKKKFFDELEKKGYIKKIKGKGLETRYESVEKNESKRVKEIADTDETTYFDDL